MNKHVLGALAFFLPAVAFAAEGSITGTISAITGWVQSLIPLLMTLAVVVFFWGLVKYIANASDEAAKDSGKTLMIWGMIALFVMVAFWGIIGYFQSSLGLNATLTTTATPAPIAPFGGTGGAGF